MLFRSLNNTTESDNDTTGALVVDGGVGIQKNLNVGGVTKLTKESVLSSTLSVNGATLLSSTLDVTGITNLNNTTESDNDTTGALVVDGGVGIQKNLNIGGATKVLSTLSVNGQTYFNNNVRIVGANSHLIIDGNFTVNGSQTIVNKIGRAHV